MELVSVCPCVKSGIGSQKQCVSEESESYYNQHKPRFDRQREANFNRI